ncbi:hypothetical protein JCM8208_000017 [Rhodotorula glutinis]
MSSTARRPLRTAGCSGSCMDRRDALARLAKLPLDMIHGDWLSEYNMSARAGEALDGADAWEVSLLEALEPALADLAANKIKFICNAGASSTRQLAELVDETVRAQGLELSVAWISGDEVWEQLSQDVKENAAGYTSLTTEAGIQDWGHEPCYAQAYLGGFGIAAALEQGADIVICGRVADASPLIGAAAWWHGWTHDSLDELAGAFVAGHLTECSNYVTGGNFTGFKQLQGRWAYLGYPLADIHSDGSSVIMLEPDQDGLVDVATCTAQLLYEIQGPLYYNSDVVADLRTVQFEQIGENQVRVVGVRGLRPPPTTKVGITARGGFEASFRYFLCGLDIREKAAMLEAQVRASLPDLEAFSLLKFTVTGTPGVDPESQDEATVEFRIFGQARKAETLAPSNFARPIIDQIMQGYPGSTCGADTRMAVPKPFYEYFVTLMPQDRIEHRAHLLKSGQSILVPPPTVTEPFVRYQESYDPRDPQPLSTYGETTTGPLGWIVHARSGDKGSDSNVGFFVRHEDEFPWLRDLLTIDKVKQLLGREYKAGQRIDRLELPHLRAVHFLLKDHLDRGVASTSSYDCLGKNVAEFLRCRHVELPKQFLERGKI